jgi:hypothetical protein
MKITAQLLRDRGACEDQVAEFVRYFGEGPVALTDELAIRHTNTFNWGWAAQNLLPPAQAQEHYNTCVAAAIEYNRTWALAFVRLAREVEDDNVEENNERTVRNRETTK